MDLADVPSALADVCFERESVAKLVQWALDHLKWAIMESAGAVS
jgi:hypothetical protein